VAVCNYCNAHLSGSSTSGTSSLHRHAKKCLSDSIESPGNSQLNLKTGSRPGWTFSQDVTREKIARMVIQHEYPFIMVEHEGFVDMMDSAQPSLTLPGRKSL
jgi:hypothetical protein